MSGGRSVVRVPVRVEDQVAVGVVADPRRDVRVRDHEVGHARVFGRRERVRAAVGLAVVLATRPAAAAPPVAVVAVLIGAVCARRWSLLPVLAPEPVRAGGDVVLGAVRVQAGDDVDLARVDERRDRRLRRLGKQVHQREDDLDGQVLARVMLADEEHARLGQVVARVVRDAHADQVPALVGGPEREDRARSPGALPRPPGCRRPSPRSCGSSSPPAGSRRVPCRGRR